MAMYRVVRFLLPAGVGCGGLWLTFVGTAKLDSLLDRNKDGIVNLGNSDNNAGLFSTRLSSVFSAIDKLSSLEKKIADLETKHENILARSDSLEKSVADSLGSLESKQQNSSNRLNSVENNVGLLEVEHQKVSTRLNTVAGNLANRLNTIEGAYRNMTSRLDSLEGTYRSVTRRLNSLEDNNPDRFTKRLNSLEDKHRDVKSGLYALEWKYVSLVKKNEEQERKIKELDAKVRYLKGREIGLNSIVRREDLK